MRWRQLQRRQVTSAQALAEMGYREVDETATIELTYSTLGEINRAGRRFGMLAVCIIQVKAAKPPE